MTVSGGRRGLQGPVAQGKKRCLEAGEPPGAGGPRKENDFWRPEGLQRPEGQKENACGSDDGAKKAYNSEKRLFGGKKKRLRQRQQGKKSL